MTADSTIAEELLAIIDDIDQLLPSLEFPPAQYDVLAFGN